MDQLWQARTDDNSGGNGDGWKRGNGKFRVAGSCGENYGNYLPRLQNWKLLVDQCTALCGASF